MKKLKDSMAEAEKVMRTYDRLVQMFSQQQQFMELLKERRGFPDFPVDLSSKAGQKLLKNISYECADELHEARQHLKQKDHRISDMGGVDRAEYVEELVDALHYFFEIVIASGISVDELYEAYMKKGAVNEQRIRGDY